MLFIKVFTRCASQQMQGQDLRQQNLLAAVDNEHTVATTDQIYHQAYQYLRICNWIALLYAVSKVAATPYFLYQEGLSHLSCLFALLIVCSLIQAVFYRKSILVSNSIKVFFEIAETTNHLSYLPKEQVPQHVVSSQHRTMDIYDFTEAESTEDQRKMKNLSTQIKYHLHNYQQLLVPLNQIQFGFYQVIHFWGLMLLLFHEFPNESPHTYLEIVILLGTYQYLEFYIIAIFLVVILPFFAIKQLYQFALNHYKAYKLQKVLKSQSYANNMKGDQECKICLEEYEERQDVIVLKCSELHHFHASCFREWAKNSSTCPLCRKDITSY